MNKLMHLFLLIFGCVSVAAAQSDDWSGFYAGGNTFGSSDKLDVGATLQVNQKTNLFVAGRGVVVVPGTSRDFAASQRTTEWNGGGQAGYQWQIGKVVFGGEGDFNPFHRTANVSQSQQLPGSLLVPSSNISARTEARISREFSLRGRAGVAFGKTLIYGTGGYGSAQVRATNIGSYSNPSGTAPVACAPFDNPCVQYQAGAEGPVITTSSQSKTMNGWIAGGGLEQKFGKRWSIGFEYRHTDLGSKTFTPTNATTINTGPEALGTNGGKSALGNVAHGPTLVSVRSDSFAIKVNFHF